MGVAWRARCRQLSRVFAASNDFLFLSSTIPKLRSYLLRRDYSGYGPPRYKKRRRPGQRQQNTPAEDVKPEGNDLDGRGRRSKDGKWMLKKVGKQIIRMPNGSAVECSSPVVGDLE